MDYYHLVQIFQSFFNNDTKVFYILYYKLYFQQVQGQEKVKLSSWDLLEGHR